MAFLFTPGPMDMPVLYFPLLRRFQQARFPASALGAAGIVLLSTLITAGCDKQPAGEAPPEPTEAAKSSGTRDYMKVYKTQGRFEDVRDFIKLAITGRGIVINNVSHIGAMLERTGKDLGATKQVYLKAEALEFCSAIVSRDMMEADPHNIVFCPYIIAVYVLPQEPDTVYVSYRRPTLVGSPESQDSLKAVEALLDDIIQEAVR